MEVDKMPKSERLNRGWLKIGEIARKLGVPVTTIRYYTEIGLLPVIAETAGGYRLYDQNVVTNRFAQIWEMNGSRPTLKETKEAIERYEEEVQK
jgi:DNA-binding transcriptional MerR regulator